MRTEYSFLGASAFMKMSHYKALKAPFAYFTKAISTFNFFLCIDTLNRKVVLQTLLCNRKAVNTLPSFLILQFLSKYSIYKVISASEIAEKLKDHIKM